MARRGRWLAVGLICLILWGCALSQPPKPVETPWEYFYMHLPNPVCLSAMGEPVDPFQSGWRPYCTKVASLGH